MSDQIQPVRRTIRRYARAVLDLLAARGLLDRAAIAGGEQS